MARHDKVNGDKPELALLYAEGRDGPAQAVFASPRRATNIRACKRGEFLRYRYFIFQPRGTGLPPQNRFALVSVFYVREQILFRLSELRQVTYKFLS